LTNFLFFCYFFIFSGFTIKKGSCRTKENTNPGICWQIESKFLFWAENEFLYIIKKGVKRILSGSKEKIDNGLNMRLSHLTLPGKNPHFQAKNEFLDALTRA